MVKEFSDVPINRFLKYDMVSRSDTHAEISMPVLPEYLQEEGVVQGGIITALADTTAVYIFIPGLPEGYTMASIELKVNFLRPALPDKGDLVAKASLIRKGRRVGVVSVDVNQGERGIATGIFTYLFFERAAV